MTAVFCVSQVYDAYTMDIAMCRYVQIYNQIRENIQQADSAADLKWWSVHRGPEMDMSWPAYEVCDIWVSLRDWPYHTEECHCFVTVSRCLM